MGLSTIASRIVLMLVLLLQLPESVEALKCAYLCKRFGATGPVFADVPDLDACIHNCNVDLAHVQTGIVLYIGWAADDLSLDSKLIMI